jgi:16S rRNA (adenine1518-N6/adenine1519-N6)-dimethyltransferase
MGIKPLKKFGQNYLIDKNIVHKMIQSLNLRSSDSVLEIGPGKGFITKELFTVLNSLTAVEIDSRVITELQNSFPNLELIEADFVKLDLHALNLNFPIKVVGNIPFNLTGDILFKLVEDKEIISEAVFILPHDLAKRIVAKKMTKEYGILTIIFNYFAHPKIIQKVSQNVFLPRPNIDAAIVHFDFSKQERLDVKKDLFIRIVKASFGNRRKTLNNSLRNSIFKDYDFSNLGLTLSKRAEELDIEDFITLTKYIQTQQCLKKMK